MPISTFFGLQTSLRGLLANQRALDVTGHNVANAGTEGYSRQEAVLSAAPALRVSAGAVQSGGGAQLGAGVDVLAYRRVRDTFLDLQYRTQSSTLGQRSETTRSLDRAELALAEPGDNGIAAMLDKFWSSWSDLANSPESPSARQALVDQGATVASALATLDGQLQTVGQQALAEYGSLTSATGDVAGMATEIAQLNTAISAALSGGTTPNDLFDRRDLLLDRLSTLARVSTTETSPGVLDVRFGDAAAPLVSGATVTWPQALTAPGGQLGALLAVGGGGGTIASYRTDLDAMAKQLADSVNAIHATPPFFTYTSGAAASTLAVNVTAATVKASTTTNPGANDLALQVAALRGGGADAAYGALVARIGGDLRNAQRDEGNAQALVAAVDDRRQSTAGVSMDEEMTNLMRFQRGYQASARALSTMDETLDTLINRTGKVGL
jgi:flagellar hook-associated protein 1 FlgK